MDNNDKVEKFVTNKWLVSLLIALMISMGGYIFSGIDRTSDSHIFRIEGSERRLSALEISVAAAQAERQAQYAEILRRLDRLENLLYRRSSPPY